MRRLGAVLLAAAVVLALAAPFVAPNGAADQFPDRTYAPPTRVHVRDAAGWRAPFIDRQVLVDRLMRRYEDDRATAAPVRWFADGRLASVDAHAGPLLLLGADALGRDVFSRLLSGARLSLGVTLAGAIGALILGAAIGGLAGSAGGRWDTALMLFADFMLVLPVVYLVLVLRAALPLVLSTGTVFLLMAGLFAAAGWPRVARGVRGILAVERSRDYVVAARAAGAGPMRIVLHMLPAAAGFLSVELMLLVPAMLVAEATLSYLGLGFPEPAPSWGTMLQETANVRMMGEAPWLLAPAVALFVVVLAVQLVAGSRTESDLFAVRRAAERRALT